MVALARLDEERPQRRRYPTKSAVERAVRQARKCDLDVAAIEMRPDGSVRILLPGAFAAPADEFERWENAGKL